MTTRMGQLLNRTRLFNRLPPDKTTIRLAKILLLSVLLVHSIAASALPQTNAADSKKVDTVRLVFVGDMMLDEVPGELIAQGKDPFRHFASVLQDADVTIGNLECVISTMGMREDKRYTFRAHPRCIDVLKKYFNAVSVANNHSGDFGKEAFADQLMLLKKERLLYFGGGRNRKEAHQPLVVVHNGVRIALLGYNEFKPRSFAAGEEVPGVAWSGDNDERVVRDIQAARKHADVVLPFMYWGPENEPADDRQRQFARKMIDAGADAVIGAHPHVTQGVDYYGGKLIVYSLGNFLFNGFTHEDNLNGWALRLTVDKNGVRSWSTVVAKLDDQGLPHIRRDVKSPAGDSNSSEIRMLSYDGRTD